MKITPNMTRLSFPNTETEENFVPFLEQYQNEILWVMKNNVETTAPYHSTGHLIGVAYLLYVLCKENPEFEETKEELIIAGLLHDFEYLRDHDDAKNIAHTVNKIFPFFKEFPQYDSNKVNEYIGYTYFSFSGVPNPFLNWGRPSSENEHDAIREADQLYSTYFFDGRILNGLHQEIGVRFGQSYSEFLVRNIQYVSSVKLTYGTFVRMREETIFGCISKHCKLFVE